MSNRQAAMESYMGKRVELEVTFNRERASAKKKFDAMLKAELVDVASKLIQDNIDTATHLRLDLIPIPVLDDAVGSI